MQYYVHNNNIFCRSIRDAGIGDKFAEKRRCGGALLVFKMYHSYNLMQSVRSGIYDLYCERGGDRASLVK